MADGHIAQVYSSIQGEGIYAGERQIFVRLLSCNLSCAYCDETSKFYLGCPAGIEQTAGQRDFKKVKNPISSDDLFLIIQNLSKVSALHHSVSITGGEPLMQIDFLAEFLLKLKQMKIKVYLETNGTLPDALAEIIAKVDIIAMDYKLPSASGLSSYDKEHWRFLEIAKQKEVFVKAVFSKDTRAVEIDALAKKIKALDENINLVLQPVSPCGKVKHKPGADQCLALQAVAKRHLKNVRVIVQMHKVMGVE
jgi:organic radical activating enzyme